MWNGILYIYIYTYAYFLPTLKAVEYVHTYVCNLAIDISAYVGDLRETGRMGLLLKSCENFYWKSHTLYVISIGIWSYINANSMISKFEWGTSFCSRSVCVRM